MIQRIQYDYIVTGSTGFIGSHLSRRISSSGAAGRLAALDLLQSDNPDWEEQVADIRSGESLTQLSAKWSSPLLLHLAAMAEVVIPFSMLADLMETNVKGTINGLSAFSPERIVFTSSSAVYGSVHDRKVQPLPDEAAAIGAYGASKVMGELACRDWARETGATAVSLRLGNVVGEGCRGLIPYLVSHAVRHPDGSVPAKLRGQGNIVRDFVSVGHVVDCILKAGSLDLSGGEHAIFNVGSGRGITNGEVAGFIAGILDRQGYCLNLNFDNPIAPGESESVILDISKTSRDLSLSPPDSEQIMRSIEDATLAHLAVFSNQNSLSITSD